MNTFLKSLPSIGAIIAIFISIWFIKNKKWKYGFWVLSISLLILLGGNLPLDKIIGISDSFKVLVNKVDKLDTKIDDLAKVYEEYYEVEKFDCSKESENIKYIMRDNHFCINLQLKRLPVWKTLEVKLGPDWHEKPDKSNLEDTGKDLYLSFPELDTPEKIKEFKRKAKEDNLIIEVRYLRNK
jgi:hypothetical protein